MTNKEQFKKAIILNSKFTGANMALVTIFSEKKGLKKGIVKIARKKQAELQKGNVIEFIHYQRTKSQLGTIKLNLINQTFVQYFDNPKSIKHLNYICSLLVKYLHEDIPYNKVFSATEKIINRLDDKNIETLIALFEYNLIKELGFSLDIKKYLTKNNNDTSPPYYISPKTGNIVSLEMGKPYHNKLLILPHIYGGIELENQLILAKKINTFLFKKLYS